MQAPPAQPALVANVARLLHHAHIMLANRARSGRMLTGLPTPSPGRSATSTWAETRQLNAIPYLITFQVVLPLLAPVIDVSALFGLFSAGARPLALTWLAFLGLLYIAAAWPRPAVRRSPSLWPARCTGLWHKLDRTGVLNLGPPAAHDWGPGR